MQLSQVRNHDNPDKHGVFDAVIVTLPGKLMDIPVELTRSQADLHMRNQSRSIRERTLGDKTAYMQVIGTVGQYTERTIALLDESSGRMTFFSPMDESTIQAEYIVGEKEYPDMVQYHPHTLVGNRESVAAAFLRFRISSQIQSNLPPLVL